MFRQILTAAALFVLPLSASAGENDGTGPVVVELFTSQSCSSCVAAADYFNELADRDDIVAIGWHVDYWNALQTRDGRWVDPYSSPAYTERQRLYNRNLRNTGSVYTPQIVINGEQEAVGSARAKVEGLIERSNTAPDASGASIVVTQSGADGKIHIGVNGAGEAQLVYLTPLADTKVRGGENAGVRFVDRNVATEMRNLGAVKSQATFQIEPPAKGERCAIILQEPDQGRILAAQYCPEI